MDPTTLLKHYDQSWAHSVNENVGRRAGLQRTALIDALRSTSCLHTKQRETVTISRNHNVELCLSLYPFSPLSSPDTPTRARDESSSSSSCATKKAHTCVKSKKQVWNCFLVWLGLWKSDNNVVHIEYTIGNHFVRVKNYFNTFKINVSFTMPQKHRRIVDFAQR